MIAGSFITVIVLGVIFIVFWIKHHHEILGVLKSQVGKLEDEISGVHHIVNSEFSNVHRRIDSQFAEVNNQITDSVTQVYKRIDDTERSLKEDSDYAHTVIKRDIEDILRKI